MTNIIKKASLPLAVSLLLAGAGPALADDHDQVRELVEQGRILPLQTVLERADVEATGQLLEAELEKEDGTWVYELELLDADGRVRELYYDAGTGERLPEFEDD